MTIPLKFLFFLFFLQVWCTLKFKTFLFLSLCRFYARWSSKLLFFLSLCLFCALWSSKPNALLHVYCDIISIVYRLLCLYLHFFIPMQLFEESGAFFMQRVYNLNINLILFRTRAWFLEIEVFSFWNFNTVHFKSYTFRMHFLLVHSLKQT